MKKSNVYLAAAFALALAFPALAADDGDIYEFAPVTSVVSADSPLGAAQTIQFKMRLLSPTYSNPLEEKRIQWQIYYKPNPFPASIAEAAAMYSAWAIRPLQIGVVVSGQTRPCAINFPSPQSERRLSEFSCEFSTKYGDLALPLKLAADGNGNAVGDGLPEGSFTPSTDASYYLINSDIWGIGYLPEGAAETYANIVWMKPYRRQTVSPSFMPPDGERNGSYDLAFNFDPANANGAYFIKTLGFDSKSVTDDSGTYWRIVNEKRITCKPDIPALAVDAKPENPQDLYLYVWSEDDAVVTLKFSDSAAELAGAGVTQETFKDKTGVSRTFWVKKIKIDGVNVEYPFSIRGADGAHGNTTALVMSAKLGYRFDGAGDLLVDYLSVPVKCGDPLEPTITVKVNGLSSDTVTTVAQSGVGTRVATLTVELSDPYTAPLDVTVVPKLAVNGVPGADALDYFGMSLKTESLSYLEKTTNITFDVGETLKTIYLYSWGADANTYGVDKSVAFVPSVSDSAAAAFYAGGMENALLLVQSIKPVIEEPVEDQLISVNCSVPYPLTIKVSDTYNDMRNDAGYELFVKKDISDLFEESLGFFKPDVNGTLYSVPTVEDPTPHLPTVTWENTATDTALLRVKAPASGQDSETRQIKLYVKPARQIGIATTDGRDGNQYKEGEDVNVTITLENGSNDTGDTIYAFLVPQGEATNAVSATWLAAAGKSGRPIPKSGTSVNALFTLEDGTSDSKQGATYDFKVELRTKQSYSEGVAIAGFESKTLTIYSLNVIPETEFVEMNDGVDTVYESGKKFTTILAKDVEATFRVYVNEPGTYDKTTEVAGKKFKTRWIVKEQDKSPVVTIIEGNPDANPFAYTFTKAGIATVEIDFMDKDMQSRWGNGELNQKFTFQVEVVKEPTITITTYSGLNTIYETECLNYGGEAAIDVNVTMNPLDVPLQVQLTIVPPSDDAADNPGMFRLLEDSYCAYTGVDGDGHDTYVVTLDGVLSQSVYLSQLDGTKLSRKHPGFTIKSKVLNTETYPSVPGKTCAEYYIGVDRMILVENDAPQAQYSDFYPMPGSTNKVALGTVDDTDAITWNFSDVDADIAAGITLTIKGGGGHIETVTTVAGTSGSWRPTFTSSGINIVQMFIVDKDGGSLRDPELIWYYDVEKSKNLRLVPHGPTTGYKGSFSARYNEADGLGEGHVYGEEKPYPTNSPASVSRFVSMYNCKLAKTRAVYGYGYKANAPVDNGTLNGGMDFPTSPSGEFLSETNLDSSAYYNYVPLLDKAGRPFDSFLYAWILYRSETSTTSSGSGGNSGTETSVSGLTDGLLFNTLAPEHIEDKYDTGAIVSLPSQVLEDGSYDDVTLEAVFSREFRVADNMGDINQDGIPDRYVVKYGLGVYDKETSTVTANDLVNVADFNEDGDLLPGTPSATLSAVGPSNAWTTVAVPFSATYEIRGYHNGLNMQGVSEMDLSDSERRAFKRYLVSVVADESLGLAPDVYEAATNAIAAFCEEAKASDAYTNETAKLEIVFKKGIWSPENPTDPTKEDTDADGLPDGYEYYYWYSAHVLGATGERYGFWTGDVSKPEIIDSKTIAKLFDPNDKRNWTANGDTDGDALPDLVEYVLGTNPVHWDSDGDGIPDGLEVMRGTDPLTADSGKNPDGDYMAMAAERHQMVVEIKVGDEIEIWGLDNLHSIDKDGKVYHKYEMVSWAAAETYGNVAYALCTKSDKGPVPQYLFLTETNDTDAAAAELAKYADANQVLADMPVRLVFSSGEGDTPRYWIGAESVLRAGLQLTTPPADENDLSASPTVVYYWVAFSELGNSEPRYAAIVDGFHEGEVPNGLDPSAVPGLVRLYRYGDAENGPYAVKMRCQLDSTPGADSEVRGTLTYYGGASTNTINLSGVDGETTAAEIVRASVETSISRYHAQVFAENGFDPRTGWGNCSHGYCAPRWCKTCSSDEEGDHSAGRAGLAVNTAGFSSLDEYRLMHYRYQNGVRNAAKDLGDVTSNKKTLEALWGEATTNPQVSYNESTSSNGTERAVASHGADTDSDGAPDGWELYVLKDPNDARDADDDEWDVLHTEDPIGDSLDLPAEFAGTDTYIIYKDVPSIAGAYSENWIWFNKFFPTNPYSSDTDGDGLTDADEQAVGMERNDFSQNQYGNSDPRVKPTSFIYGPNKDLNTGDAKWGYASDDGSICIRGGGLNPCTVDTDGDLLPDLWEWQFAGVYRLSASEEKEPGGYIDFGMDGTDPYDSYTYKRGGLYPEDIDPRTGTLRNFDFDIDGLQNFQEYLVQALRHLRYDVETVGTRLESGDDVSTTGIMNGTPFYMMTMFGPIDYIFGPMDVDVALKADDVKRRGFFGTPPHDWDSMILRRNGEKRGRVMLTPGTTWTIGTASDIFEPVQKPKGYVAALRYATTDPRMRDTDYDGMDDFYEIYHGLNPLLGEKDGMGGIGSDIVAEAYEDLKFGFNGLPLDCFNNFFTQPDASGEQMTYTTLDFVKYPWLAGMPLCDPDGDGLRNDQELIQVNAANPQASNTDPTPLWMTDSSFAYSYTAQYYPLSPNIARMWPVGMDAKSGAADIESSECMFSYEMNEGYDTDNDGIPDGGELTKTVLGASDPQLFTDPASRQALYLPGPKNGVSSLAISYEPAHPVFSTTMRVTSAADIFRQFTVECWIRPAASSLEDGTKCTVLERICSYPPSGVNSSGDPAEAEKHYVRANFRIGIDSGRLYGLFDNSDARVSESYLGVSSARVSSEVDLEADKWYHVALTFDGSKLAITVHRRGDVERMGRCNSVTSTIMPANGVTEILQQVDVAFPYYTYLAYDSAFVIGASADETGLNLQNPDNPPTAANYSRHYVGYIGEVRVCDGARTANEIAADYDRKLTYSDAISLRAAVYDSWAEGGSRSSTDGTEVMPPEFIQLYTFDGIHGATDPAYVAAAPAAFNRNVAAPASKSLTEMNGKDVPVVVGWRSALDPSLKSTVYTDEAYVPWVKNLFARLPLLDGSVADSVYWGENLAGDHTPAEIGVSKFVFLRTANPYVMASNFRDLSLRLRRYGVLNGGKQDEASSVTNIASGSSIYSSLLKLYRFDVRSRMSSTSDLVLLGGAYVHRCTDFWDGQGAMDADIVTTDGLSAVDEKGNGLPDWWEEYCRDNYMAGYDPGMAMTLDTVVNYGGIRIKASEAYLRDLAKGMLPTTEIVNDYIDVADFDSDGLPDWWENMYGINEGEALSDSDNDGLSNIIEYMLSERFGLEDANGNRKMFSPNEAFSYGSIEPDYFFRVGSLYVGEMFADHDWIEDWWENDYDADYVSLLEYDVNSDNDDDGWSAWSEARYSQQVSPIVANNQFHYNVTDGLVWDYPVPTVQLKVHYNGRSLADVRNASMGVKIGRTFDPSKSFDAEYYISGTSKGSASAGAGTSFGGSSGSNMTNLYTRVIGKWSNRRVYGTLTPGFINPSDLALQVAYNPSDVVYSWELRVYTDGISGGTRWYDVVYRRGSKDEYLQDCRTYGVGNVTLLSTSDGYKELEGLEIRTDLTSEVATLRYSNGIEVGTVNLKTGEYELDLGVFANGYARDNTNDGKLVSLEDQTYRIVYSANESTGIPRDLYLGEADIGRIYEGENNILVWADLDGNGNYDVGEPFGAVRGVDISWRRRSVEVELFDESPTMPRIDLVNATSDRGGTVKEICLDISNRVVSAVASQSAIAQTIARLSWMYTNRYESVKLSGDSSSPVRVRVVRWMVDDYPVYQIETSPRVVFDKFFNPAEHPTLTEADLLADGDLDIDWKYLNSEVVNGYSGIVEQLPINRVAYLVVIGDGPDHWTSKNDSTRVLNIVNRVIERKYDSVQAKAEVWSPGNEQSVVYAARPTFKWTIPGGSGETGYTAFRIRILNAEGDSAGAVVWDSGAVALPPRDSYGRYVWAAPAYVGNELRASVNYKWQVSALNAKFPDPSWSEPGVFRMEPEVIGAGLGRIDVCVKYFGPKAEVLEAGRVVVEAFESPDFTGYPASRAIVTNKEAVAEIEAEHSCLVSLKGLKGGRYYVRAYIDSSRYGTQNAHDDWESWGYLSDRSGSRREMFEPVAMEVDELIGAGDLATVYVEDADTNGNRLPDAWEMYANGGSLDNGSAKLDETLDCGLAINKALAGDIQDDQLDGAGAGAIVAHFVRSLKTRGFASLALGVSPDSISVNQSGQIELENKVDSVEIEELSFVGGKLTIAVSGKVAPAVASTGAGIYDVSYSPVKTVTCEIYRRASLAAEDGWELAVPACDITVGSGAVEIEVSQGEGPSGFYKVVVK